ncbi:MAG: hypothetical protein LBP50_08685 [Tannerella sp.]|nr:hypothetical protein [Tannerella sp.]
MLQTVIRVLDEHEVLYTDIPAFIKTVNDLKHITKEMERLGEVQSKTALQEIINEKNASETALVNRVVTMANVLSVLAADTNNTAMRSRISVTKSLLYWLSGNEQLSIARRIHTEALAHADTIAAYGISVGAIYELETAVSRHENRMAAPQSVAETKTAAESLVRLFADTDTLLNDRLDRLMSLFEAPEPDFYEAYFNARNVISAAVRRRQQPDREKEEI